MKKLVYFIDGFNLYHSMVENRKYAKYKWLNLDNLCRIFTRKDQKIEKIYYFTSYASWNADKMKRHQIYVRALEAYNIKPVFGKFKVRDRHCNKCNKDFKTHEEKQTDVNIAIKLLQEAVNDSYDIAMLISGDSDLIPAVQAVRTSFPAKQVGVIIPVERSAEELKNSANFYIKMKEKHLATSQLPDNIEINGIKIEKPGEWK